MPRKKLALTLTWWQAALYESAMIALGIIIGLRVADRLKSFELIFWAIFVLAGSYVFWLWLIQLNLPDEESEMS